ADPLDGAHRRRAATAHPRRRHPDDGLRLHRGRGAREHPRAAVGRDRRRVQRRERAGDESQRARRCAARHDELHPAPGVRAGAQGQPGAPAPGGYHEGRAPLGLPGAGRSPRGAESSRRVVAGERDRRGMIPIINPEMDEREVAAAGRAILSGWITQGPEVAAFEREFAAFVGAEHGCAVSSCTTALHLALLAVGVRPGDEVVTVSHSYIATANAIRYCGATPIFVDVEPDTFNIDPTQIEGALTDRTRAILCVHQMGMPCDLAAILPVARRARLAVVEDAACASGSEIRGNGRWEKIGRPHGDIACFSFHPRKVMSTGDGGMITTSNADWDARCRLLRQHGMSVPDTVRHGANTVIFESYPVLGYNYRMTDIQAAVGRE